MALDKNKFNPGMTPGARGKAPVLHSYISSADTLATIIASGYFDELADMFSSGDLLYAEGSDAKGFFKLINTAGVITTLTLGVDTFVLQVNIADISTAGQEYVVSPYAGEIITAYSVINGAIITGDADLTLKTAAGTVGIITVAISGSAAGIVDEITSVTNAAVAAGATVEVETDGVSGNTIPVEVTILLRRT